MAHHIPEHKIIIVQTVIFIGLLVLLSFILEGCTSKGTAERYVKSSYYISAADPAGSLCGEEGNEGVIAVATEDCISFSQPELYAASSAEKENFVTGDSFEMEIP